LRRKGKGKERQKETKRSLGRIWQGLLFPQWCGKWGIRRGFSLWVGLCDPLHHTNSQKPSQIILVRMMIP